jgi:hypothetical protein
MTKKQMVDYLNSNTHVFRYSTKYACSIKLHSQSGITDKEWKIATDENLSRELWDFYLSPMIEDFKANTGYEVYTGGRSGGWIYIDNIEIVDESNTYQEVKDAYKALDKLETLKRDMFAELKSLAGEKIVKKHYTTKHEYLTFA